MKNRIRRITLFFLLTVILNPGLPSAAVIELQDGTILNGIIRKKQADAITVSIGNESRVIPNKDIRLIRGRKPQITSTVSNESRAEADAALFQQAIRLAGKQEFEQARTIFKKLSQENPRNSSFREAYNICLDLEKGSIDKDYAQDLFRGADALLRNDYAKAIEHFLAILNKNPQAHEVYYNLASAYQAREDYKNAAVYYEKLLEIEPYDTEVLYHTAQCYYSDRDYEKALYYLNKALEQSPDRPELYLFLAKTYYQMGNPAQARYYYDKALALSNNES